MKTHKNNMYRVSNMDWRYFKEVLWLCYWCQAFLPIIFMVEKCVHFDIWNNKKLFFTFSMIGLIFKFGFG